MKRLFAKKAILAVWIIFAALAAVAGGCIYNLSGAGTARAAKTQSPAAQSEKIDRALEQALYTEAEFFGAAAIVPFPTEEARRNVAALLEKHPREPKIILKSAELDERSGDYEKAERQLEEFVALDSESESALEILAAFYARRARFESEAATLERILKRTTGEKRARVFARLIESARKHKLENRLQPDFYRAVVAEDAAAFSIVEQFIAKLIADENHAQALEIVRQMRAKFPERGTVLFAKEIEILLLANRAVEAETIYHQSFNLFWSDAESAAYYQFLNDQNRLRAYKSELRARFEKNPADFDAATRLFHFEKNDFANDEPGKILAKLETARRARKINWQPDELLIAARLLLAANDGEAAARFLYTLFAQNKLEKNSELRARVLYQLFKMLSDAAEKPLVLTDGNLDFYRDVARSDSHPGILTGALSLIFSDTNPAQELDLKERTAFKLFNRAAARRIFEMYKAENPQSPQLAQMYLDVVRLHQANNETELAASVLAEFEARADCEQSADYPVIALKLADAFVAAEQFDQERRIYQKLLDFLAKKQRENSQPLVSTVDDREPTATADKDFSAASNPGVEISVKQTSNNDYYSHQTFVPNADWLGAENERVTYQKVLNRFAASLARENRASEILGLYANERAKYPDEAGLDEALLEWLGRARLAEKQLAIYQSALQKFPGEVWQDRLARWFLRHNRKSDFARFSAELIEKAGDAETQNYLNEFINRYQAAQPETFDAKLYLALYAKAHERFPHNLTFVKGLLEFYDAHDQTAEWHKLAARYYFESTEVRQLFLDKLAKNNELREQREQAGDKIRAQPAALAILPYKLFRADAAVRLSDYEAAIDAYAELDRLYPNTAEYTEKIVALTRSLGQIEPRFLNQAVAASRRQAEHSPASAEYRTRAGEIYAAAGDFENARREWQKIIETARGEPTVYLETAAVYWDYFEYAEALRAIQSLRDERGDPNLYAFEAGAIWEAKKDVAAALGEYVKALDGSTRQAENRESSDRAKQRLEIVFARAAIPAQLETAFQRERANLRDNAKINSLVLGYVDLLRRVEKWDQAKRILRGEVVRSRSNEFLAEARELCAAANDTSSEQTVLRRLAAIATDARAKIKFNLQLAEGLSRAKDDRGAIRILNELVAEFPTNHGVLNEATDFLWRIGARARAVSVLQTALQRARGESRTVFGRKLAARLVEQKRDRSAETVLHSLYVENPLDYGVFNELVKIYVRGGDRAKLQTIFDRTLSEIKAQNHDFREINEQVADLRQKMIVALTRLESFDAAIAQHIAIINREPDNEEHTTAAIAYARRFGGAQTLLDYYQKTASSSFKNYRWFAVLARIHEANNDFAAATENYRIAIHNQPEMLELHDALVQIYEQQNDFAAAIQTLEKMLELSNDEPATVRRLIRLLEKTGRAAEAEIWRQKLPVEAKPKQTAAEQFAGAAALPNTEKDAALEAYRRAFDAFAAEPLKHKLATDEITGYVSAVRAAEPLDAIADKLWQVRAKLVAEADNPNSINGWQARSQRSVLDHAIVVAVGGAARDFATSDERARIFDDLAKRIENSRLDAHDTGALLQNLAARTGFGLLEEQILVKRKNESFKLDNRVAFHQDLTALIAFYRARGDFARIISLLETERARDAAFESYDYAEQIAENARLVGDAEKELTALREYFARQSAAQSTTANQALIERYFAALLERGESARAELIELTEKPTIFQVPLINFLLAKEERELAQRAIENSAFPTLWKKARHAQTDFAFADFGDQAHARFRQALDLKTIGETISAKPQPEIDLANQDWAALANVYGKWLDRGGRANAEQFLLAGIENRPQDENQRRQLAQRYLEKKDFARAVEHSEIWLEINPANNFALANLGAARFLAGDESAALKIWRRMIEGDRTNAQLYFETLEKYERAAIARQEFAPILIKHLKDSDYDRTGARAEIHLVAKSFGDHQNLAVAQAQAAFLLKIARAADSDLLSETVVADKLTARNQLQPFYEKLIENSASEREIDHVYTKLLESGLDVAEAEAAADAEQNYEPEEAAGERIKRQREYLDYLLAEQRHERAQTLISEIEKSIEKRFARPIWLRLARLQLDLRTNPAPESVLPEFKNFVGINPNCDRIIAPSLERLNRALDLLGSEKQQIVADELRAAVYWRLLALERFEKTTFVELASLAFRRRDADSAIRLLQTMIDLTDDARRAMAARELAESVSIKQSRVDRQKVADQTAENLLEREAAFELAASTAVEFGQFDQALDFRRQFSAFAPQNANRRFIFAHSLPGSRRKTRKTAARWQNFWLAGKTSTKPRTISPPF